MHEWPFMLIAWSTLKSAWHPAGVTNTRRENIILGATVGSMLVQRLRRWPTLNQQWLRCLQNPQRSMQYMYIMQRHDLKSPVSEIAEYSKLLTWRMWQNVLTKCKEVWFYIERYCIIRSPPGPTWKQHWVNMVNAACPLGCVCRYRANKFSSLKYHIRDFDIHYGFYLRLISRINEKMTRGNEWINRKILTRLNHRCPELRGAENPNQFAHIVNLSFRSFNRSILAIVIDKSDWIIWRLKG